MKIGEIKPNIDKDKALDIHGSNCDKPYIIMTPSWGIEEINIFNTKFYKESYWECLNCKWRSETIRKRTL